MQPIANKSKTTFNNILMKKRTFILSLTGLIFLMLISCNSKEKTSYNQEEKTVNNGEVQVIQFHLEHRCMTCNKIELLTKETLKEYPSIQFSLINVDEAQNEQKVEEFEAFGTALFLYNPSTKEKKNLTEFAFMSAGNKEKFIRDLKKEI